MSRAFLLEIATARQGFVRTMHGARIGTRQDQNVRIGSRLDRGADLDASLLARNDLLAPGMPAFLRCPRSSIMTAAAPARANSTTVLWTLSALP